jgi:hypothetical protein
MQKKRLVFELQKLALNIYEVSVDIDMIIDELDWEQRHKEEVRRFNKKVYDRNRRLVRKYESWWLGKLCKPTGTGCAYRRVVELKVSTDFDDDEPYPSIIEENVYVTYEDGASHRVNRYGSTSMALPTKWDMQIYKEKHEKETTTEGP